MKTIQNRIMDLIAERLLNIKTANGYSNNIDKIKRERVTNFAGGDIPILFYWGENDIKIENEFGYEKRNLSVGITMFVRTRDEPFTDTAYDAGADIKTALNRDILAPSISDIISNNLGYKVNLLSIDEIIPVIAEGQSPFCGVVLTVSVEYFAAVHDSYTILIN